VVNCARLVGVMCINMESTTKKYDFGDSWDLTQVNISRKALGCPITLQLDFSRLHEVKKIELRECRDYGIIESLLDAERVVLSKMNGNQTEFGSIQVECFSESYAEYFCDEVHENT